MSDEERREQEAVKVMHAAQEVCSKVALTYLYKGTLV